MNKFHIIALGAATALVGTSANAETRNFDFDEFSKVAASAGVNMEVAAGGDFSIRVESNDEGFEELKIAVKDGALKIGRDKHRKLIRMRQPEITAYVTLPALEGVSASSGSDVVASGVDAEKFSVSVSSGADISVAGKCDDLSVSVSSGADMNGKDLQCKSAAVSVSSGADATVYASETVTANASSGGDIAVFGGPKQHTINKSSGGDVSIRN